MTESFDDEQVARIDAALYDGALNTPWQEED